MRRFCLLVSFFALLLAVCVLWAYRFERAPGLAVIHLADLKPVAPKVSGMEWVGTDRDPRLRIGVDSAKPRVAVRCPLPGIPPVDLLHVRFRLTSHHLVAGNEPWADGRFLLEWHAAGQGGGWESDSLGTIRDDIAGDMVSFVTHPGKGPAIAVLRLENLGKSGDFELSEMELTVVRERWVWKWGRWFLAGAWFFWAMACIRSWYGASKWRVAAAALIWVLLGIELVVPGPWKFQRAIYPEFRIENGSPLGPPLHPASYQENPVVPGAVQPMGRIPDQGSLLLRVKHLITEARPLLHVLLFFGPALLFAFLVGRKPSVVLVAILALAVELAEFGFGYGFGLDDVVDLSTDAAGIALAIWLYGRLAVNPRFFTVRAD